MVYSPASSSFPASKDTPVDPSATSVTGTFDHAGLDSYQNDAIENLQNTVGTTSSTDTDSHNYKLTNASSSDPGHKHTLANGATDITASLADLNAVTNFEETISATTSKVTIADGAIDFDIASHDGTNGLKLAGTLVTSSAAELNLVDGLTAGTATASKVVLLDTSKDFDFDTGDISATDITATSDVITDEIIANTADTPVKVSNGAYTAPISYTPAGAATATLDVSNSNLHTITMPAGNITIAISNETVGQIFIVEITQDGTGSRTVTWFTTIKWADGSAPTLTTTADKRDTFAFRVTGVDQYDGYVVGQNI